MYGFFVWTASTFWAYFNATPAFRNAHHSTYYEERPVISGYNDQIIRLIYVGVLKTVLGPVNYTYETANIAFVTLTILFANFHRNR